MSYLIVAAVGALCFAIYWFAVTHIISASQETPAQQSTIADLHTDTPKPTPPLVTQQSVPAVIKYIPSLDLVFDPGSPGHSPSLNLLNHGTSNIYLWGDKLGDGPKSIDEPRTITPTGAYHIWADNLVSYVRSKIANDGELKLPFHIYVTTDDKVKHILKYLLWIRVTGGVVQVETQNMGTVDVDFLLPNHS